MAKLQVRIPERDAPRFATLVGTALIAFALGLAIAWWGTTAASRGDTTGSRASPQSSEREGAFGARPNEQDGSQELEHAASAANLRDTGPATLGAAPRVGVSPAPSEPGASPAAAAGDVAAGDPTATESAESESAWPPEERPSPSRPRTVRRGRVAYLRCDGVRRRGGRFPCPRDDALEATVWSVVEGLIRCEGGPVGAGHADVKLDYPGHGAPEVHWRDTFADDVVRLDRDEVIRCLEPGLVQTRQSLGAERLLVSFRFSTE